MNILHIPNYYKPHIGGIEQTAHDICEATKGYANQQVLCFSEGKNDYESDIDGVHVTKCGYFKKVSSQALSLSYGKKMRKIFLENKFDVVIFHYPNPFVAHYLLKYH